MLYSTSRSGPPQSMSRTPQSEASSSNQSQKDQEMQFRNSTDGLVPLPFNSNGAFGSGTSTRDLENSLQKAQENFIKSQIEVRKNLDGKSTQITSFHATLWCDQQALHTSYNELDRSTMTAWKLQYHRYFCCKLIFSCNRAKLHTLWSSCVLMTCVTSDMDG